MEGIPEEMRAVYLKTGDVVFASRSGNVYDEKGNLIKQKKERGKYLSVRVGHNTFNVHRIIAEAYLGSLPENNRKIHVHHINGNVLDNRATNLRIMTSEDHHALHQTKYSKTKTCVVCGKEFTPKPTKRKRQQTCSPECRVKLITQKQAFRMRSVAKYTKDGILLKVFDSTMDAARDCKGFAANIVKCCRGEIQTYKGFVWKYYDRHFGDESTGERGDLYDTSGTAPETEGSGAVH